MQRKQIRAEADPGEIWSAVKKTIKALLENESACCIKARAISSNSETSITVCPGTVMFAGMEIGFIRTTKTQPTRRSLPEKYSSPVREKKYPVASLNSIRRYTMR